MADLRLLTAALALGALVATSCWTPRTRVLHTPVVAGRVIDHETHEPVVCAEVFVYRYALTEAFPHNVPSVFAVRWTTTDAEGRFHFPAEETPVPEKLQRSELPPDRRPAIRVIHQRYGVAGNATKITDVSHIEWEAIPNPRTLEALSDPGGYGSVCGDLGPGYYHCCEAFFGPDSVCLPRGWKKQ